MSFRQQAYLERLGFKDKLGGTLQQLASLQAKHLYTIPFENLDIHNDVPITLNIEKIYTKIIEHNRGGFCYELNGLFYTLLLSLGFDAKLIEAQVYSAKEEQYGQHFDHMAICVYLKGKNYLVDVGFGEFALSPLEIANEKRQKDARGSFVIKKNAESYIVYKQKGDTFTPEYAFSLTPQSLQAFSEMCVYHQTSPQSHFTQKRLISLAVPNGRVTISGNQLILRDNNDVRETVFPETEFSGLLTKYFGY